MRRVSPSFTHHLSSSFTSVLPSRRQDLEVERRPWQQFSVFFWRSAASLCGSRPDRGHVGALLLDDYGYFKHRRDGIRWVPPQTRSLLICFLEKKKVEFWPEKDFSALQYRQKSPSHHLTTRQHKILAGFMFCPLSCCPPRRRRLKQTVSRWVIHLSNLFGFYAREQPFSPQRTFPPEYSAARHPSIAKTWWWRPARVVPLCLWWQAIK